MVGVGFIERFRWLVWGLCKRYMVGVGFCERFRWLMWGLLRDLDGWFL